MDIDSEILDMKEEQRKRRIYMRKLHSHPDCRDPDHPGCPICEDEEDGTDT